MRDEELAGLGQAVGTKTIPLVRRPRALGLPLGRLGITPVAVPIRVALEGLRPEARRGAALGLGPPGLNAAIRRPRPHEPFRVHGPAGVDAVRPPRAPANVPGLPNGEEGRVHPPRPVAAPPVTARVLGAALVGVTRRITLT